MKKFLKLSDNLRNAAKISSGTAIGQLISIVTLPLVTRLYGAEIMGTWAAIHAIAFLIYKVNDLGLTQAIMVADEEEMPELLGSMITLVTSISLILALAVWGYCVFFVRYDLEMTIVTVACSVFYAFSLQIANVSYTWLNREKQYSVLMKNPILNYVSMTVISLALGWMGFIRYGYYLGVMLAQFLTLLHMWRFMPKIRPVLSIQKLRDIITKNINFVKYQMPSSFMIQLREELPNLLIGGLFGNAVLGCFSISTKILNVPVTFIGQALGKVFYQRLAEMKRNGQTVKDFIFRNVMRGMKIAVIPMMLLMAYGDAAVVMFFGEEYAVGGVILRIVVARTFFTFISTTTQGMDIVLGKQKYAMMNALYQSIAISASVVISFYATGTPYWCAAMMTASFIVLQVIYFCRIFRVIQAPYWKYVKNICIYLGIAVAGSFVLRYAFIYITDLTQWAFFKYLAQFLVM